MRPLQRTAQSRTLDGIARPTQHDKFDRSFIAFLVTMGVVAVLTVIAFVVFGPPEINGPIGPSQ